MYASHCANLKPPIVQLDTQYFFRMICKLEPVVASNRLYSTNGSYAQAPSSLLVATGRAKKEIISQYSRSVRPVCVTVVIHNKHPASERWC